MTSDLSTPLPLPPGQCPPRSETGSAAVSVRAVWSRTHGSPEAGGTTRRPHNRGPGGAWPPPRVRGPREGRAASLQLPRPLPQVPRRRPSCQPSCPPSERGGGGGGGAHPLRLVPGKTRARRVASPRLYGAAGRGGGAGSSSVHSTPGVSQGCPPPVPGSPPGVRGLVKARQLSEELTTIYVHGPGRYGDGPGSDGSATTTIPEPP